MRTLGLRVLALALAVGLGPGATAGAAVFTVDNDADSGVGSLRQAILDANASAGEDEIVFDLPDDTVILLGSPLPDIEGDVVLNAEALGVTAQGIVVRGDGVDVFRVGSGTSQLTDLLVEEGQLQIAGGATLSFEQTVDGAFADTITEDGGFEKLGPASLTLSGSNDYSGGTAVREGTLIGDTDAIPGDVVVDADARLSLEIAEGDDETFSGLISGEGSFEKAGDGTLRFDGQAHSYEGGTSVSGGTLVGDTTSLQGDIANDATLVFQMGAAGEYAGEISGTGGVEKTGETLTLSGENSFSGGLTLTEGGIVGDSDSIPGDVSMAAATRLVFDQAMDGTHAGNIDGEDDSSVEKRGPGALTLAGSNDYGGGTSIVDGALIGDTQSLPGNFSFAPEAGDSPALVFDQGFDAGFDGVVDGDGDVTKRGAGNLSFSQTQTYTGATTIEQGRLLVDAGLGGAGVGVEALGALGGNGSVSGGVTAEGIVGPGPLAATATESIGLLAVDDVVFERWSVFEVHASESANPTPGGPLQGDRLSVTGVATIRRADLRVIPEPGTYETPVDVDILTAPSILGAGFNQPDDDFAFLTLTLTQTATSVKLVIEQDPNASLTGFAETPNQLGVAAALEAAEANGSNGDLDTVLENFFTLFADDVAPALDDSAGEALTGFPTLRLAIGDRFHTDLHERVRSLAVHRSDPVFAQRAPLRRVAGTARAAASGLFGLASLTALAGPAASPGEGRTRFGVWLDGYGLFGDLEGGSGAKDLDYTVWGVSAGLDLRPAAHWVLGFAGGWAGSDLEFQGLSGTQQGNTAQGALYGGYASPRFRASASLRAAWNDLDSKRRIVFAPPATLDRSAKADFDGWDYGGRFETGLNFFRLGGAVFEPLAAFSYARVEQEGFSESGAGSLDLSVKSQHVTSCESGVGARIHGSFQIDELIWMTPELRGRWTHEFCDLDRRLSARIGGTPGASYVVRGAERPRDGGVAGVSWTVTHADRLHFFAEYDAVIDSRLLQHSVAVGLEALF
jgi:autotransporter-associated beta strand protein